MRIRSTITLSALALVLALGSSPAFAQYFGGPGSLNYSGVIHGSDLNNPNMGGAQTMPSVSGPTLYNYAPLQQLPVKHQAKKHGAAR